MSDEDRKVRLNGRPIPSCAEIEPAGSRQITCVRARLFLSQTDGNDPSAGASCRFQNHVVVDSELFEQPCRVEAAQTSPHDGDSLRCLRLGVPGVLSAGKRTAKRLTEPVRPGCDGILSEFHGSSKKGIPGKSKLGSSLGEGSPVAKYNLRDSF